MTGRPVPAGEGFGQVVARHRDAGRLVVQPRMGFGTVEQMRRGLLSTKHASATTVGTITLDSYTRVNDHAAARRHLDGERSLNGYPLVAQGPGATKAMLAGVVDGGFPVQVRHGSPDPHAIFRAMLASGLHATEGGPVSYCLPYGRTPLTDAISAWGRSADLLADQQERGVACHVETFGGCLLGQLCPPSLLVAVSVLEGLFFRRHGLSSISLSYAQQTSPSQDLEALGALRRLARRFLPDTDWHVVIYTYMGLFPSTTQGAAALLDESVRLATQSGTERLIVKTVAEASRIPTVAENVAALEQAAATTVGAAVADSRGSDGGAESATATEALALIEAVLDLDSRLDRALARAFELGVLDIPFCLHPDNRNRARSVIAADGRLEWADTGQMPLPEARHARGTLSASALLTMLGYTAARFDALAPDTAAFEGAPCAPRSRSRGRSPSRSGASLARS